MIKRFFILVFALGCLAAISMAATPLGIKGSQHQKCVKLSPKQIETIRAIQPWLGTSSQDPKPRTTGTSLARISSKKGTFRSPKKINTSGSTIQGWRATDEYSGVPKGWYEVNLNGSQTFKWDYHDPEWVDDGWSEEPDFPFTTGFYRNGKVYGFHAEMILCWLVWGHGSFTLDGVISDYVQYGDNFEVTDFSTYVLSCAYDSDTDLVYAFTLNEDASGYMLQVIDPSTWAFREISKDVSIEDILVGFSYNPVDKQLYGMTPDSRFVTLDPVSGQISQVAKFSLPVNTSIEGMTYSPYDKAFILIVPSGDDSCDMYTIDPNSPELVYRASLDDALQYRILITPDVVVEGATPLMPEILSIDFVNGSSDGKAVVKLPANTFDGSILSGNLELVISIDGAEYNVVTGVAGETIEVGLNGIAEGIRKFSFAIRGNGLESAEVQQSLYVGFDTPVAPQNIELQSGLLSWDPVTSTVNGGYLDEAELTYNVYLNGQPINKTPIAECEFVFTMPEAVYQKYVAQVEAVNHGHTSERGFSNDIKEGHAFPVPFSMAPTGTEAELVKIVSDRHPMLAWRAVSPDPISPGYFTCHTTEMGDGIDEWLFMPAINVPAIDNLLEISFEVSTNQQFDNNFENIAVAFADSPDPSAAVVVKRWDNLVNENWGKLTAYCLPESGTKYLGFLTTAHADGYNIMVRNISVKESGRPAATPAAVSDLKAEALPEGELKAKVSFTMPLLDASGNELEDKVLTANVRSEAAIATVSGAPGEKVAVEVATVEGVNTINVIAANSFDGLESSVEVFTGTDVPKAISIASTYHTEDYKGIHIEWDNPTEGANGGYVNPTDITYSIYYFNEEEYEWQFAKELGKVTSCDIKAEIPTGIEIVKVGLLAQNSKGNCGSLFVVSATAGNPYALPMYESFRDRDHIYNPVVTEIPSDEYVEAWWFGSSYPYWIEKPSLYGEYSYIMSSSRGKNGRVVLPAFSTENVTSAGIEIPLFAVKDANEIRVLARSYDVEPQLLGVYEGTSEPKWNKCRFHLPNELIGKKWVEILIDGAFLTEEESVASFDQYKVQTFMEKDLAVVDISAPVFAFLGEKAEITAVIENQGINAIAVPCVELTLTKGNEVLGVYPMELIDGKDSLEELDEAVYKVSWTPYAECYGDISYAVSLIGSDMEPSNDKKTGKLTVGRGNSVCVIDLEGELTDDGVSLSWTDPEIKTGHESFEGQIPYYYGDMIGNFKTVCRDEYESLSFIFHFPYGQENKAWQVMSEKDATERMAEDGWDNTLFTAYSGDRFIMAVTPLTYFSGEGLEADRWLISPEVKGGSDFSFMMAAPGGRYETVEALYSSTDDDPDSFSLIESINVLSADWKLYNYSLPENARYFAIRYVGNTDDNEYVILDDIEYVSAVDGPELEGYDIYRGGVMIAENVNIRGSYVDSYKPEGECTYNVVPVLSRDGELTRGLISNTAFVALTGITEIEESIDANAEYYTLQGIRVQTPQRGVYIKRKGNKASKIIII